MQYLGTKQYLINPNEQEFKCYEQMRKSRSKQRQEIKDQLTFWILNDYIITFNTYTLNDKTYNTYLSDIDILQSLLTRLLKKYSLDYIGNIDYGSINDRLHFHVLEAHRKGQLKEEKIGSYKLNITSPLTIEWEKYGFTYPEIIRYETTDQEKLSSYLSKLCNHSIKIKTKRLFKMRKSNFKDYKLWIKRTYSKPFINEETIKQYINYKNNISIVKYNNNHYQEYKQMIQSTFKQEQYELINLLSKI